MHGQSDDTYSRGLLKDMLSKVNVMTLTWSLKMLVILYMIQLTAMRIQWLSHNACIYSKLWATNIIPSLSQLLDSRYNIN